MEYADMSPEELAQLYDRSLQLPVVTRELGAAMCQAYERHRWRMLGGTITLRCHAVVESMVQNLGPRLRGYLEEGALLGPYVTGNGQVHADGIGVWMPLPPDEGEQAVPQGNHRRTVIKRRRSIVE